MTKWIILLRVVGTIVFVVGGIGGIQYMIAMLGIPDSLYGFYNGGIWIMLHIPLAVICFAVAAALKQQQLQDRKLNYIANRLVSRPRRVGTNPYPPAHYPLPPSMQFPKPLDLAPDAPAPANTARYAEDGERIRHTGSKHVITRMEQDYIDRRYAYRVADPNVRHAPRPVRQTPGSAGQYMDEELEMDATKKRPLPNPSSPYQRAIDDVPDKELLRLGREAYLRRQQGGQGE